MDHALETLAPITAACESLKIDEDLMKGIIDAENSMRIELNTDLAKTLSAYEKSCSAIVPKLTVGEPWIAAFCGNTV